MNFAKRLMRMQTGRMAMRSSIPAGLLLGALVLGFALSRGARGDEDLAEEPFLGSEEAPAEEAAEREPLPEPAEPETEGEEMELLEPAEDDAIEMVEEADDRVSISVTEGRIQDVLRSLAAMRPGTTIMIDPEVSGELSFELQEVPWRTALSLVAEAQGLEIVERAEDVYLAQPAVEREESRRVRDLEVELFTSEEIEQLPEMELRRMYKAYREIPEDMTTEDIRQEMMENPDSYVKRLSVDSRRAIEVINQLARESSVDFVFSTHFKPEPDEEERRDEEKDTPPISLNLRNRHISSVIRMVAEQGGLSASYQDGTWVVKPMRPEERELEPLVGETFQVRYIRVDDKLVEDLEKISSERGEIITRGKIITVFDTADRIEQMDRVLTDQDVPTPQVLIEARFFNLSDTTSHELGIDWRSLGEGMSFRAAPDDLTYDYRSGRIIGPVDANEGTFVDPRYLRDDESRLSRLIHQGYLPGFQDRSPADLPDDFTAIDPRTATLTLPSLEAVLYALEQIDKAEQLSNPKILVSSDEQATIHIGRQEPILRSTVATIDGETFRTYELDTNFGGETVQVADLLADQTQTIDHDDAYSGYTGYLDLGTKLTVAPSVKTDDEVYIRVIPELINKPGEITVGQEDFRQSFPELYRVRVQTQFTLRSGQTIAIGGLVSEDLDTEQRKVPFLHRIPMAGRLFQYDFEREIRSETIIFLTVWIIAPDELDTVSGVPVSSRRVQSRVNQIREEDAAGAGYNEELRQQELRLREEREAEEDRRRWPFGKGEKEEEAVPEPEPEPVEKLPEQEPAEEETREEPLEAGEPAEDSKEEPEEISEPKAEDEANDPFNY